LDQITFFTAVLWILKTSFHTQESPGAREMRFGKALLVSQVHCGENVEICALAGTWPARSFGIRYLILFTDECYMSMQYKIDLLFRCVSS
jgi:hypothetical protein